MAQPSALEEALSQAYRYLGLRDRTVDEVRRHLTRRAVAPQIIDECVAELARQEYLDDVRFARAFAADRRELDGWGNQRIAGRLRALGVGEALVHEVVAGQNTDQELDAAVELLRRRLRAAPADERGRRRALGLLVRRGYELEVAYDAVRRFERGLEESSVHRADRDRFAQEGRRYYDLESELGPATGIEPQEIRQF